MIETEAAAFRTVIVLLPCRFDCAVAQSGRAREGAGAGGNDFVPAERERERGRALQSVSLLWEVLQRREECEQVRVV